MDYKDADYQPIQTNGAQYPMQGQPTSSNGQAQTKHDVPKCNCCGYIGPWKEDPVFRPVDYIVTIILLLLGFVPGIAYAGVVLAIRSGKHGDAYRTKHCTNCGAKNMFTFLY